MNDHEARETIRQMLADWERNNHDVPMPDGPCQHCDGLGCVACDTRIALRGGIPDHPFRPHAQYPMACALCARHMSDHVV